MSDRTSGVVAVVGGETLSGNKDKRRAQVKARVEAAGFAFVSFRQFKHLPSYPVTYSLSVTVPGDDPEAPIYATHTIEITGQAQLEQHTADPTMLWALIQRHRAGSIAEGLKLWRKQSDMEGSAKQYGDLVGRLALRCCGVPDPALLDQGQELAEQTVAANVEVCAAFAKLEAAAVDYLAARAEYERILAVVPPPTLLPEVYESAEGGVPCSG